MLSIQILQDYRQAWLVVEGKEGLFLSAKLHGTPQFLTRVETVLVQRRPTGKAVGLLQILVF